MTQEKVDEIIAGLSGRRLAAAKALRALWTVTPASIWAYLHCEQWGEAAQEVLEFGRDTENARVIADMIWEG